jgi:hypothetical protein
MKIEHMEKVKVLKTTKLDNGVSKTDVIHEGVVVEYTSRGARIWNPKDPADSRMGAEWFPYASQDRCKIVGIKDIGRYLNF